MYINEVYILLFTRDEMRQRNTRSADERKKERYQDVKKKNMSIEVTWEGRMDRNGIEGMEGKVRNMKKEKGNEQRREER